MTACFDGACQAVPPATASSEPTHIDIGYSKALGTPMLLSVRATKDGKTVLNVSIDVSLRNAGPHPPSSPCGPGPVSWVATATLTARGGLIPT